LEEARSSRANAKAGPQKKGSLKSVLLFSSKGPLTFRREHLSNG